MKAATPLAHFSLAIGALLLCTGLVHADTIYVSDYVDNTIVRFGPSGQSVFASASSGLDTPSGLAFDNSGNLYVANSYPNSILRYNSSGQASVFATWGVWQPEGMAFDRSGNLYVANWYDNTIVKFDSGGHGSVFASGLSSPTGLAFDSAGNLFVANRYAPGGTVMKFDPSGHGSVFASGLSIPSGLAVDRNDNLYVATADNFNSMLRYDPAGHESVFASNIQGNGGQVVLWGLAFNNIGYLDAIVGNMYNGTVEKFDSSGALLGGANMSWGLFIAVEPIPEPSTWAILALGAGAFLGSRWLHHRALAGAPAAAREH